MWVHSSETSITKKGIAKVEPTINLNTFMSACRFQLNRAVIIIFDLSDLSIDYVFNELISHYWRLYFF